MNARPTHLRVTHLRVARPTDRLVELTRFYGDVLGLPELLRFEDHAGYDGVLFGLPGAGYHLEFTSHVNGSACPAPTKDNLLVFYLASANEQRIVADRLATAGFPAVDPENPYWSDNGGVTVEDPDGWRLVLMAPPGL